MSAAISEGSVLDSLSGRTRLGALLLTLPVGLLLRTRAIETVFLPDGVVRLGFHDAQFHARRALYSFVRFPETLGFDSYLAYPNGAPAPVPPLFDWLVAAAARLIGDDIATFEIVAAWVSPVLGALLAIPAFWIGRSLAGPGLGLAAAWLVTVLPAGHLQTYVGNCDHHAAVALIAGCWLASSVREVGNTGRALAIQAVLHACVVSAMLLIWSGSLLYIALGEGTRLVAICLFHGRRDRLLALAATVAGGAVVPGLWLLSSEPPLGGLFTGQTLSWLHIFVLLSLAFLAVCTALIEGLRPARGPGERLLRLLVFAAGAVLPLLALPDIREALEEGLRFLGKDDDWAAHNPEQTALFASVPLSGVRPPTIRFGFFAYWIPVTPLAVAVLSLRVRDEVRERMFVFVCWITALCVLVLSQVRYGTDFAVPGAVAFALMLAAVRATVARRLPRQIAAATAIGLAVVMLWPVWQWHAPVVKHSLTQGLTGGREAPRGWLSARESAFRWAEMLREMTPETSGYLTPDERPEYAILVHPTMGHLVAYTARRPAPANNLGPYLDRELYSLATSFYEASDTPSGLRILEQLGTRYVVTGWIWSPPGSFAFDLHRTNGSAEPERSPTGRLRLLAQGPRGGRPISNRPVPGPVYKLFERVEGAILVVTGAEPSTWVRAEIRLTTPAGEQGYRALGRAAADGVARVRVPYPSASRPVREGEVGTLGSWIVRVGEQSFEVEVTEKDVAEGREVRVGG